MKKKNVVGVRSIVVVLIIAVLAGGFWYVNDIKKQEGNGNEQEQIENIINKVNDDRVEDKTQTKNSENLMFKKFTSEEVEELKKRKGLVWYEIPELSVEFLVTQSGKKDLKYTVNKNSGEFGDEIIHIAFYSKIEVEYKNDKLGYRCFQDGRNDCNSDLFLSRISFEYNEAMKRNIGEDARFVCRKDREGRGRTILIKDLGYYICGEVDHQSFNWHSQQDYDNFIQTLKNDNGDERAYEYSEGRTSIYLGTIRKIK